MSRKQINLFSEKGILLDNVFCIKMQCGVQVSSNCTIPLLDEQKQILFYYIHTEKYSPKSYVVNFRTQISSSQSEGRTMVFTREKNDTSNQNSERCFFTCEKNDTSNQKPHRCVSFAPKFPPFIAAYSAALYTFNEKSFTQRVFLPKKK